MVRERYQMEQGIYDCPISRQQQNQFTSCQDFLIPSLASAYYAMLDCIAHSLETLFMPTTQLRSKSSCKGGEILLILLSGAKLVTNMFVVLESANAVFKI